MSRTRNGTIYGLTHPFDNPLGLISAVNNGQISIPTDEDESDIESDMEIEQQLNIGDKVCIRADCLDEYFRFKPSPPMVNCTIIDIDYDSEGEGECYYLLEYLKNKCGTPHRDCILHTQWVMDYEFWGGIQKGWALPTQLEYIRPESPGH